MTHSDGIKRLLNTEFAYGTGDCVVSIADYYRDVRGYDPLQKVGRNWNTQLEAYRKIKSMGKLEELPNQYGFVSISRYQVRDGDLAVVKTNHNKPRPAYGIVSAGHVIASGNRCYSFDDVILFYRKS